MKCSYLTVSSSTDFSLCYILVSCGCVASYWHCPWLRHPPPHCNLRWAKCAHLSGVCRTPRVCTLCGVLLAQVLHCTAYTVLQWCLFHVYCVCICQGCSLLLLCYRDTPHLHLQPLPLQLHLAFLHTSLVLIRMRFGELLALLCVHTSPASIQPVLVEPLASEPLLWTLYVCVLHSVPRTL